MNTSFEDAFADINTLSVKFNEILDHLELLYKLEKLLQSERLLNRIKEALQQFFSNNENEQIVKELHQRLHERIFVRDNLPEKKLNLAAAIEEEGREAQHLIREFASGDGWTLMKDHAGITTHYRHEDNSPLHSIKIQGVVDSPLLEVMAVIYETDMFPTWVPMLTEARVCKQISRFRKAVYVRADLPWPISNRDVCLYGYGVDALEDDMVLVVVRSCTDGSENIEAVTKESNEELLYGLPQTPSRHVRMTCIIGGMLARPISATSTHITFINNTDPKLSTVPYWFLNLATKKFAPMLLEHLRHVAAGIRTNPDYQERIKANPEVYEEAR